MSATYDPNLETEVDQVRFLIGDTDPDTADLQDAEIEWLLERNGRSIYTAAITAARSLGARFTAKAESKSVGDLSISYGQRAQRYFDLVDQLKADRDDHSVVGGIALTNDQEQRLFTLGQDDHRRAGDSLTRERGVE